MQTIIKEKQLHLPAISSVNAMWVGVLFSLLATLLIWAIGGRLNEVSLLSDQGSSWYYWKLPNPTFWTRFSAWGSYTLHQLIIWYLIYYGQRNKLRYSDKLHRVNFVALGVNAFFILWHVVQSHIWYDGLAQDMPVWSSQWSVIILLVAVLLMENQRRGLFFGKKVGILKETGRVMRKYHGYLFAWGIIYTFWFHPAISSGQHLIGFFYMFLLLLQSSLFFTRIHVNKWWMVVQEVTVTVHGAIVAFLHDQPWQMFLFGFLGLFVVTQMYGLGLKRWLRWLFLALYSGAVLLFYNGYGWVYINEPFRIPLGEYALVFIMAGLIWVLMRLVGIFAQPSLAEIPVTGEEIQ